MCDEKDIEFSGCEWYCKFCGMTTPELYDHVKEPSTSPLKSLKSLRSSEDSEEVN